MLTVLSYQVSSVQLVSDDLSAALKQTINRVLASKKVKIYAIFYCKVSDALPVTSNPSKTY